MVTQKRKFKPQLGIRSLIKYLKLFALFPVHSRLLVDILSVLFS